MGQCPSRRARSDQCGPPSQVSSDVAPSARKASRRATSAPSWASRPASASLARAVSASSAKSASLFSCASSSLVRGRRAVVGISALAARTVVRIQNGTVGHRMRFGRWPTSDPTGASTTPHLGRSSAVRIVAGKDVLGPATQVVRLDIEGGERPGRRAVAHVEQREQKVLRSDRGVPPVPGRSGELLRARVWNPG